MGYTILLVLAGHLPLISDVWINGRGPYTFGVDTGLESTLVDAALARELRLTPRYRVALMSTNGFRELPGGPVDLITVGRVEAVGVEVLWDDDLRAGRLDPRVRGVLGQSFLRRFAYLLDYTNRTLVLDSPLPPDGPRTPLAWIGGRPALRDTRWILDSGAPHEVRLGRHPEEGAGLLPTRFFAWVYVNSREDYAVLGPPTTRRRSASRTDPPLPR
jgi:hypothetical protein